MPTFLVTVNLKGGGVASAHIDAQSVAHIAAFFLQPRMNRKNRQPGCAGWARRLMLGGQRGERGDQGGCRWGGDCGCSRQASHKQIGAFMECSAPVCSGGCMWWVYVRCPQGFGQGRSGCKAGWLTGSLAGWPPPLSPGTGT